MAKIIDRIGVDILRRKLGTYSPIRQRGILKLQLGEVPVIDARSRGIASVTNKTVRAFNKKERVFIDTSVIAIRATISFDTAELGAFAYLRDPVEEQMEKIYDRFCAAEIDYVNRSVAGRDVVYSDSEDVKKLQKLFDDVGKPVLVLSRSKKMDATSDGFVLVERTPVSVEVNFTDPYKAAICVWEDVGFYITYRG